MERRRAHLLWNWDLETGRALVTLEGHTDAVTACAGAADGRRVLSASDDRTLKVWDLETGRALATLEGHTDAVRACAVMADGRRVVSASNDRTLKVWDLETGRALATLEGHTDAVRACAVMADGRHVVSASHDRTLKVWDVETQLASSRIAATPPTLQSPPARQLSSPVTALAASGFWTGPHPLAAPDHIAEVAAMTANVDPIRLTCPRRRDLR